MVVEDEALIAVALEDDLADASISVGGPFASGSAALEWMKHNRPDVAVVDGVLRDGPSLAVGMALKAQGVPFVIYSGHDEADQKSFEMRSPSNF